MLEAIPKNIFSTSFRLQQQNQPLGEVGTSIWREKARLEIGTIYPLGVFTLRTSIDLPADWPLPIRVFLFWLAFVIWKRQNQAAAS